MNHASLGWNGRALPRGVLVSAVERERSSCRTGLERGFGTDRDRWRIDSHVEGGNVKDSYPTTFAIRLMHKDFGLVLREAAARNVPMPATAVTAQMCAAENAKGVEEDLAAVIKLMESLAAAA